jgi:hypothetical protein
MDISSTDEQNAPALPAHPATAPAVTEPPADRLSTEVRDSLLLLLLSFAVTAGLAGAASALVSLLA